MSQAHLPPLPWHDEADLLGVRVRVHFFNPAEVDARADTLGRLLPILQGSQAQLLGVEGQRETFRTAGLQAQPDAVFVHGNGLLCLGHKGGDGRPHDIGNWRAQWRADVMLQCLASAMAVAGARQQPTAALWRGVNVLCQFDPSSAVLECLATHISAARHYWNNAAWITPAQLASFCEPRLRALPGLATVEPAAA
jgi:hypothetical protein